MILADTSVWIDFLRDVPSWQTERLTQLLAEGEVMMGDLILLEILQGIANDGEVSRVSALLEPLDTITIGGRDVALQAAGHYRRLRRAGITIRSSIDTLIATRCILDGVTLLHGDRDFDPFEELGLRSAKQVTH